LSQQNLKRSWYIVVEGAIGVGKTTLARMLSNHFRTGLLLEVFEENPFLAKFYESRAQYAFQTQMFFLLSRYRQQKEQVPRYLEQGALISDYMFAKDWLFAQLNLAGDEWEIYQQIHGALAEQIPAPDLIVYLQADTEVLLGRIAQRDRTYERDMDRDYIAALRVAYERFFPGYQDVPVLHIDTDQLNVVTTPADFQFIVERIRSILKEGMFQPTLPQLEDEGPVDEILDRGGPLAEYQRFHDELDRAKGFNTDMYFNYLCLSEEIGELSSELVKLWIEENALRVQGESTARARQRALGKNRKGLESELADCMAYLLKIANYAGIDLEQAYLGKMRMNQERIGEDLEKV
jgi:deoxyadenosine/deoxycytidine kinase/NTP pyrophosphatase (non-canonical NTP hydrolase)